MKEYINTILIEIEEKIKEHKVLNTAYPDELLEQMSFLNVKIGEANKMAYFLFRNSGSRTEDWYNLQLRKDLMQVIVNCTRILEKL